jgi:hypothetical protein
MDIDALHHHVRDAGFIFRARPLSELHGKPPQIPEGAGEIVAAQIDQVLRSTDSLRDLAGKRAFIVTKNAAALQTAHTFIFFTQVLSLGQELLVREVGHTEPSAETMRQVEQAIREEDGRPLRERVAAAELIVEGEVVASRVLERPFPPPSEHYPDWGVARLAVGAVLKGRKPRGEVEVLFAASLDRVWFRSPKMQRGVRGVFLLFRLDEGERPPAEIARSGWQALDPLDLQPVERRDEIERLIGRGRGEH